MQIWIEYWAVSEFYCNARPLNINLVENGLNKNRRCV